MTTTTATTTTFQIPFVASNEDSWGPPPIDEANPNSAPGNVAKFAALPYSPFGRSDRLGRAADFANTHRPMSMQQHQFQQGGGGGGGGGYSHDRRNNRYRQGRFPEAEGTAADENTEDAFQLVDTTKVQTTKRFMNPANKRRQQTQRLRQINARRQQSTGGAAGPQMDKMTRGRGGRGGGGRGGGRGGWRHNYNNRVDRQPSVAVRDDWTQVDEIDLAKFAKNITTSGDVPTPDDLLWCGFLDPYNDAYDKITSRQPVALKRMEQKEFYYVTTTDDPVMEKLACDGVGQIFITDAILAHLMTCTRSVFPWDIVVHKLPGGTLFFDKRNNGNFDYLSVNETAYNPPSHEDGENTPERLGLEATMVNQNFSQQVLKKSGRKEMDLPNPFFDEDDAAGTEPSGVAYRYRKFALDDKTTLVCRTELHGLVKQQHYMTAFALNEYNSSTANSSSSPQTASWRDRIDSQRGAVFANELKNNSFKLAKWTAQSLLAGADQMKIGFVSRASPHKANEHVILATQFYRPKDFATQITLSENQMVRTFIHQKKF